MSSAKVEGFSANETFCETVLSKPSDVTIELLTNELRRSGNIKSSETVTDFSIKMLVGGQSGASISKISLNYKPPEAGPPTVVLKLANSEPEETDLMKLFLPVYNVWLVRWITCIACYFFCKKVPPEEREEHDFGYEVFCRYEPILYGKAKPIIEQKAPLMTMPKVYSVGLIDKGNTKYDSCGFCCCRKLGETKSHVIMEDLSAYKTVAIDIMATNSDGSLSRPGIKYGWSKHDPAKWSKESECSPSKKPDISLEEATTASLKAIASLHSSFWKDNRLLEETGLSHEAWGPIVTGIHWWARGKYREGNYGKKGELMSGIYREEYCAKYLQSPIFGNNTVAKAYGLPDNYFDPLREQWVMNFLYATTKKMDEIRLHIENLNYHETLVHHDYHNGNILYKRDNDTSAMDIKIIDWQMCGAGAACTDVAQIFLMWNDFDSIPARLLLLKKSLLEIIEDGKNDKDGPTLDTSFEDGLIKMYHEELVAGGVIDYSLEDLQIDITKILLRAILNTRIYMMHNLIEGFRKWPLEPAIYGPLHSKGGYEGFKKSMRQKCDAAEISMEYFDKVNRHQAENLRDKYLYNYLLLKTWACRYGVIDKNVTYTAV